MAGPQARLPTGLPEPPVAVLPDGNVTVPTVELAVMAPPSTTVGMAGAGAGAGAGGGGAALCGGVDESPPPPQPAATRTNNVGNHFDAARLRDVGGIERSFMACLLGLAPWRPPRECSPMRAPAAFRAAAGQSRCP